MNTATRILPILTASLLTLPLMAHAASPGCATVEVQNVRPQQGRLMVAAYNSAETFSKTATTSLALPAGDATMRFELCGLSGDTVALTLFQDLNSDGKLGTNLLGVPNEPWGASGHPGMMGPKWETTKVSLDGRPIVVQMSK
ncbi:MAG: DUF2141 domain-containing protein [Pseudomonadota bacterium]|nr:DUF2141 domain-containing protein [Pseudomonadota bacterium]